jgi:NADPH:quinone reductase-like Zn-dependent oxidoreductase
VKSRALHSTLTADGHIRLTLDEVDLGAPNAEAVIVRVDATPVNPTDLALMLSGADLSRAAASAGAVVAPVPVGALQVFAGRIDRPLPLGTEAAGR